MRLLITGAAGLVGTRAASIARERGHHVELARHEAPAPEGVAGPWHVLERTAHLDAERVVEAARPDWVIDLAAWTDVDGCERDPERAMAANAHGAARIAEAAASHGARVCFVSTDFVFDGAARRPYVEDDAPAPQGAYARSKLAGEQAVLRHAANAVVR